VRGRSGVRGWRAEIGALVEGKRGRDHCAVVCAFVCVRWVRWLRDEATSRWKEAVSVCACLVDAPDGRVAVRMAAGCDCRAAVKARPQFFLGKIIRFLSDKQSNMHRSNDRMLDNNWLVCFSTVSLTLPRYRPLCLSRIRKQTVCIVFTGHRSRSALQPTRCRCRPVSSCRCSRPIATTRSNRRECR